MTGGDVGPEIVGRADLEHLGGAGEALEQRVVDRLVHEDAGGGEHFWPA